MLATYPVTMAFLRLLHTLVKVGILSWYCCWLIVDVIRHCSVVVGVLLCQLSAQLEDKTDIEASLAFCLSEILSTYDKWKYNNSRTHMQIGESVSV